MKKNILLLSGGGGQEHDVSLVSVQYLYQCLSSLDRFNILNITINHEGKWLDQEKNEYFLDPNKRLIKTCDQTSFDIAYAIPCIHGFPGETGDIQSYFEMIGLDFMGCNSETSKMCFNKVTTKLWATALGVANTPYVFLSSPDEEERAIEFYRKHQLVVVKASNQGSSVGCYFPSDEETFIKNINEAFSLSNFVLIEKRLIPRELEVSVYEYDGKLQISYPGEVICPSKFYSFEEKYSKDSKTITVTKAEGLEEKHVEKILDYSTRLYKGLKIRHLSRIDFFLANDEIYFNEVNTFPGLTPISMFPKMLEANNHSFKEFLAQRLVHL